MTEYEKKIQLTREEYIALKRRSGARNVKVQTNHYFDTDSFCMNKKRITCRIREKNGVYKTTIKNHSNADATESVEIDLYEGKMFYTQVFDALGLHYQGKLITERILLYQDCFLEAVLDRNTYLEEEDFELEVEFFPEEEERAINYLKEIAADLMAEKLIETEEQFLHRIGKEKSKSERFFRKKQNEERRKICC